MENSIYEVTRNGLHAFPRSGYGFFGMSLDLYIHLIEIYRDFESIFMAKLYLIDGNTTMNGNRKGMRELVNRYVNIVR